MEKENNAMCTREKCDYHKGFHSNTLRLKDILPVQCPRCKRYGSVERIKK